MDTVLVSCPYCGESLEIAVDWSVHRQEYVEDCHVCCRPMTLVVSVVGSPEGGRPDVMVRARSADD
jgi:hypothetical protein